MQAKTKIIFLFFAFIFQFTDAFSQVKEYFIECDPADFEYIYGHFEEDIYIPISFTYDGVTWTDTEMRIRGDGSRYLPKKSLKVRFNGNPFANGRDKLNFNAEYEDKTYMRAFLSSRVFRMTGQKCFDTDFARLYLNGDFLGLYQMTENMDDSFLEANGYDPAGNLFKATKDGACLSVYDDLTNFWEQKTGSGNKEDLALLIDEIDQVSINDYPSFCTDNFDYGQMVNMIACNMVLSNQSTYYHNYYMYHDVNGTGKWQMLPWDLDKTFSLYSWRNHTYSSARWTHDNPYLEKAILNQEMMEDVEVRANEIFDEVFNTDILWPMMDSLIAALQPSVEQDTTDDIENIDEWLEQVQTEKNHVAIFDTKLNWYFNHVQSSFTAERTPNPVPQDVTFNWSPSVDPDGLPVEYHFYLTSGFEFEPELTTIYEGIGDTVFTIENIEPGDYFWKVVSVDGDGQEVESFDSKNPLKVTIPNYLPCEISEDMVLIKENSPYLVNCNIEVMPGAKLTLEKGVEILVQQSMHILVKGGFAVNGTKDEPVVIRPNNESISFDSLVFINPDQNIDLNYLTVIDGSINARYANIEMDYCKLILNTKIMVLPNVIYGNYWGNGTFNNSTIIGNGTGQGLEFGWCGSVVVENSDFHNIDDPIELISVNEGWVKNNFVEYSSDDGIDFNNCINLVIENNRIYYCNDKGITIGNEFNGPSENILILKNLIVDCTTGITVKDGSSATIDRTTINGCEVGVKIWEKNPGQGASYANIINTIISNTSDEAVYIDEISSADISYSLCNTEELAGTGNLFEEPLFVSIPANNFLLQESSPCINSGDPESEPDPDGTRADMGMFYYNFGSYNVIFNEINYKSSPDFYTEDWVEFYNADEVVADISGWEFKDKDDDHIFEFPYGTVIYPGQYLVLCSDAGLFSQLNPEIENYIGSFPFGLSSGGELIRLYNHTGTMIDSMEYGVENPWPTAPNGQGPTLELRSPLFDNALPESWCASENYGTPGKVNSCNIYQQPENDAVPFSAQIYPNPASGIVYLKFISEMAGTLRMDIYSDDGRLNQSTKNNISRDGPHLFIINTLYDQGIYIVNLKFEADSAIFYENLKLIKVE